MRTPHTYTRQSLAYRLKRLRFLDTFCCKEATRPKVLTLFVIVIKVLVLDEFKVIIVKIFLDLSLVICKDSQQLLKREHMPTDYAVYCREQIDQQAEIHLDTVM